MHCEAHASMSSTLYLADGHTACCSSFSQSHCMFVKRHLASCAYSSQSHCVLQSVTQHLVHLLPSHTASCEVHHYNASSALSKGSLLCAVHGTLHCKCLLKLEALLQQALSCRKLPIFQHPGYSPIYVAPFCPVHASTRGSHLAEL